MPEHLEIGAYEAKTHLLELLRKVRDGASFTITQRGTAVAELIPVGATAQRSGVAAAADMRTFMQEARTLAGAAADGPKVPVDTKSLIADGRD